MAGLLAFFEIEGPALEAMGKIIEEGIERFWPEHQPQPELKPAKEPVLKFLGKGTATQKERSKWKTQVVKVSDVFDACQEVLTDFAQVSQVGKFFVPLPETDDPDNPGGGKNPSLTAQIMRQVLKKVLQQNNARQFGKKEGTFRIPAA